LLRFREADRGPRTHTDVRLIETSTSSTSAKQVRISLNCVAWRYLLTHVEGDFGASR